MTKLISHRGNLNGPDPQNENHPDYILAATAQGFEVEIDLWFSEGNFALGHDEPSYEIKEDFLRSHGFYIHAKSLETLDQLLTKYPYLHFFWHDQDKFTLTSRKFIWTFPNENVTNRSIIVCKTKQEVKKYSTSECYAICTDYIL
jgi:hypothetical protein